jgi:endonuclease YncB( thermonuclease family)
MDVLKDISKENCPPLFTMNGKKLYCKVIDVYDGDTCNIVFICDNKLQHYRFRLYGINCKEIRPKKNIENRQQYIELAKSAKKALEDKVLNKVVFIEFVKEEKFGRLMGTIYSDDKKTINFNEEMKKEGHAVCYK